MQMNKTYSKSPENIFLKQDATGKQVQAHSCTQYTVYMPITCHTYFHFGMSDENEAKYTKDIQDINWKLRGKSMQKHNFYALC